MWEHVSSRSHEPQQVFPYGPDADEVMLHGKVSYGFKDGRSSSKDWAARAKMTKAGGEVKMSFYQVYLVRYSSRRLKTKCYGIR